MMPAELEEALQHLEAGRSEEAKTILQDLALHPFTLAGALAKGLLGEPAPDLSRDEYRESVSLAEQLFGASDRDLLLQELRSLLLGQTNLTIIGLDSYLLPVHELAALCQVSNLRKVSLIDPNATALSGFVADLRHPDLQLSSHPVAMQEIPSDCWSEASGPLFANFSLHYLSESQRDQFLADVSVSGRPLLLLERDLAALNEKPAVRARNAWSHFRPYFRRLEQLPNEILQRKAARLAWDAVSDDRGVVCTHLCEDRVAWRRRLQKNGYQVRQHETRLPLPGSEEQPLFILGGRGRGGAS